MLDYKFAPQALVFDADGNKIGQMSISAAKKLAVESGLDLIEVSRQGDISICRIIDQGKWKYEQKKLKRSKLKQSPHQKEVKFGMRIDEHDKMIKINHVNKFLDKGFDVYLVVEMRGRERRNSGLAQQKMQEILELIKDCKEEPVKTSVSNVSVLLHPIRNNNGKNR